jgi:hypothetical protein
MTEAECNDEGPAGGRSNGTRFLRLGDDRGRKRGKEMENPTRERHFTFTGMQP